MLEHPEPYRGHAPGIVVGIRDAKLSQRLQMDSALDLSKAKTASCQAEPVQEQRSTLNSPGTAVDSVRDSRGRGRRPSQNLRCIRFGRGRHPKANVLCAMLPATIVARKDTSHLNVSRNDTALRTNRLILCKTRSQYHHKLDAEQSDDDEHLTDEVYIDSVVDNREKCWTADLLVGQTEVKFKLDTGAEATAISERTNKTLVNLSPLESTSLALFGPGRTPLNIVGQFLLSPTMGGLHNTLSLLSKVCKTICLVS